jgi:DNA processing protein
MRDDIEDWVRLNLIPGVGPIRFFNLLSHFGSPSEALKAGENELTTVQGIDRITAGNIVKYRDKVKVREEIEKVKDMGADIICFLDDSYSELLRNISHPPPLFYIKGELKEGEGMVAIVGTRMPSAYGRAITRQIAGDIARCGITVVSGLAKGIDSEAHIGALEGGRTVAVLGSGLANIYPWENKELAERITKNGAVISEFPMSAKPRPEHFPRRNRIISGLSYGVVVAEAPIGSGALITASHAASQGRDVMAVPGPANARTSRGTNKLIKDGAYLVEDSEDVLSYLGFSERAPEYAEETMPTSFDENQQKIFAILSATEPVHIDDITRLTGLLSSVVSSALMDMELAGFIVHLGSMMYVKSR